MSASPGFPEVARREPLALQRRHEIVVPMKIELIELGEFRPAESNPKDHDIGALTQSLARFGAVETPVVDGRTGRLVAGHGRIEALIAMRAAGNDAPAGIAVSGKEWRVPTLTGWASRTDAEAKAYLLASNRTTELGGWDKAPLESMLVELAASGDLVGTGWDADDVDSLIAPAVAQDDFAEPSEIWVRPGDMFALGQHRLICGDSTNDDVVSRIMGEDAADIMWTDPPWNVAYAGIRKPRKPIANDNLGDAFGGFLAAAMGLAVSHIRPGGAIYVAMSSQEMGGLMRTLEALGCAWSATLVWVKQAFVLGRRDYHAQYEPIWYGWKSGAPHHAVSDRSQSDVWNIDRPQKSDEHPTMKPVELVTRALKNSSNHGDICLEPFSGSGTTLLACETTGRKCRAIELEPRYVQVALERWEKLTSQKHVKVAG